MLFSGTQRNARRTKLRVLIVCVIVGLLVAGALAAALFFMNKHRTG
jgi:flagellar basal body-associated protein FliL